MAGKKLEERIERFPSFYLYPALLGKIWDKSGRRGEVVFVTADRDTRRSDGSDKCKGVRQQDIMECH